MVPRARRLGDGLLAADEGAPGRASWRATMCWIRRTAGRSTRCSKGTSGRRTTTSSTRFDRSRRGRGARWRNWRSHGRCSGRGSPSLCAGRSVPDQIRETAGAMGLAADTGSTGRNRRSDRRAGRGHLPRGRVTVPRWTAATLRCCGSHDEAPGLTSVLPVMTMPTAETAPLGFAQLADGDRPEMHPPVSGG